MLKLVMRIMKKISIFILLFLCHNSIAPGNTYSQEIPDGPYFGQKAPGFTSQIFAPDIISIKDRFEYVISFSPEGNECCFGVTNFI